MFLFSPVEFAARPEAVWLPENRYEHIYVDLLLCNPSALSVE